MSSSGQIPAPQLSLPVCARTSEARASRPVSEAWQETWGRGGVLPTSRNQAVRGGGQGSGWEPALSLAPSLPPSGPLWASAAPAAWLSQPLSPFVRGRNGPRSPLHRASRGLRPTLSRLLSPRPSSVPGSAQALDAREDGSRNNRPRGTKDDAKVHDWTRDAGTRRRDSRDLQAGVGGAPASPASRIVE